MITDLAITNMFIAQDMATHFVGMFAAAEQYTTSIVADGLSDVYGKLKDNWLGPAYTIAVAVMSIVFLKDRAWMKLLSFLGIAVVVGVLIFYSDSIFKKDGGGFVESAKGIVTNTVDTGTPSVNAVDTLLAKANTP